MISGSLADEHGSFRRSSLKGGIAPERVVSLGVGADEPLDSNRTAIGRARNSRVDIILIPADSQVGEK